MRGDAAQRWDLVERKWCSDWPVPLDLKVHTPAEDTPAIEAKEVREWMGRSSDCRLEPEGGV